MTDDELKTLVASLAVAQKETTEEMRRNSEEIKQFMQKTDKQIRETNATVKSVSTLLGNMGRNQGDVTEEFFFNSLCENTYLGSIHFDDIAKNEFKHRGNTQEEFDILLTNDNAIGIIEVKYKAHETDLDKLERKMRNFKKLYPIYETYKLYGAIAAFHIYEDAKTAALERGFFVLQRKGKIVTTESSENLLVL